MTRQSASSRRFILLIALGLASSCSDVTGPPSVVGQQIPAASTTIAPTTTLVPPVQQIIAGRPMPGDRCQANRDSGPIVYATGAGYNAATPTIQVLLAIERGYFEQLCLDVQVVRSTTADNYALVAAGEASFAAGSSYSELVDFAGRNDAEFVAATIDGYSSLDALIIRDPAISTLDQLRDTTIGAAASLPVPVAVMLAEAGLAEPGDDPAAPTLAYQTTVLDDPDVLLFVENTDVSAMAGTLTNEVFALRQHMDQPPLQQADLTIVRADASGVPGSFGVLFTTGTFTALHPSAAEDFIRASRRALAEAISDPRSAIAETCEWINQNDPLALVDPTIEAARWNVERSEDGSSGSPRTQLDLPALRLEVDRAIAASAFDGPVAPVELLTSPQLLASVYDADGAVVWPGK